LPPEPFKTVGKVKGRVADSFDGQNEDSRPQVAGAAPVVAVDTSAPLFSEKQPFRGLVSNAR
jgi:hypothetical protein